MHQYRIKPGASFRMPDGSLKTAGDTLELPDDVARMHAGLVEQLPPPQADAASADTHQSQE